MKQLINIPYVDGLQTWLDSSTIKWKIIIAGFTVAQYAFETYLTYRQYKTLQSRAVPPILKDEIDVKTVEKAADYSAAKIRFSVFSDTVGLITSLAVLKFDFLPRVWNISVRLGSLVPKFMAPTCTIRTSLYMIVVLFVLNSVIELPLSYYRTFVLEEKYGFNKMTFGTWVSDFFKSAALTFTFGLPLGYAVMKIIQKFSTNFVDYVCLFLFVVQILAQIIVPNFIMPLFNKFTPLEDGELKTAIEGLAKRLSFPLDKVLVVDGSKRSSHSNAYFIGLPFTTKRIVLYDTLIEQNMTEELCAVLAHEIGHWKLNHIAYRLVYSQLHLIITLTLFKCVYQNRSLYETFGFFVGRGSSSNTAKVFVDTFPILIGFVLFGELFKPMSCAAQFIFSLLSRTDEYQADQYAKGLGFGENLCRALITLHKENLSSPSVDSWYSAYHYSHPTLPERLGAVGYKAESKKE